MFESEKSSAIEEIKRGEELMKCLYVHLNPHSDEYSDLSRKVLQSLSNARDLLLQQETKLHSSSETQSTNDCSLSLKRKKQTRDKVPNKRKKTEDSKSIFLTMAPHYDGYKWRKYGEKTIQNSAYPRTYYRCTYKDEGCLATKKIQQQDDDEDKYKYEYPIFQVIYENKHTCNSSRVSNDEYELYHHDQSGFTMSEAKRTSSSRNATTDNVIVYDHHDLNSFEPDIDPNMFNELSSTAVEMENDTVNCYFDVEKINFHMSPISIPCHWYEQEYNHDLESLLTSFV